MFDKIDKRINELYDRLDNLEGCEDNPVYAAEVKTIREELSNLLQIMETELF